MTKPPTAKSGKIIEESFVEGEGEGCGGVIPVIFAVVDTTCETCCLADDARLPKVEPILSLFANATPATTLAPTSPAPRGVVIAPRRNRDRGGYGATDTTFESVDSSFMVFI